MLHKVGGAAGGYAPSGDRPRFVGQMSRRGLLRAQSYRLSSDRMLQLQSAAASPFATFVTGAARTPLQARNSGAAFLKAAIQQAVAALADAAIRISGREAQIAIFPKSGAPSAIYCSNDPLLPLRQIP